MAAVVAGIASADGKVLTDGQVDVVTALADGGDLYIVGPPGTGKTAVVDWWIGACEQRGEPHVLRRHLHDFFVELHRRIDLCGGWESGLRAAVSSDGRGYDVVCLDEFTVHDPADGVFLDRLLRSLRAQGIRVVVTSNRRPDELMPNPLFHVGFAPTIAFIDDMFDVIGLDDGADLRVAAHADRSAARRRGGFASGQWRVVDRVDDPRGCERIARPGAQAIAVWEGGEGEAGVRFADLCALPTGPRDYLWLAREYSVLIVTDVRPDLGADSLARWAALLDVTYDVDVRVDVESTVGRAVMAEALLAVLPDAPRTISRMAVWRAAE